ncbi:hypothetical protein PVK06_029403 [Gossypium arboreum]|uniref:Disease resistance protein At4g27190-like leucine-rich repeats domain-containing protein n=1 Tax=Gossypium arboreum TaxID=29729 RepID=A0ABR0P6M1_GOSAR|nr:hypothetical protein PVK06_029403 [Gossypium arboreum]
MLDPIAKYFKYHRGVKKYMMILHKKLEELKCRKDDIESRLNIDLLQSGKTLKKEVQLWLDGACKIISQVDSLSKEVGDMKYLSRARLGKKITVTIKVVDEHHRKGAAALPKDMFSNLKSFRIHQCPNIKRLFTPGLLLQLHSLSVIEVTFCPQMKDIIAEDNDESIENHSIDMKKTTNHPMLRHLVLCELPKLKSIYTQTLHCDSLQVIEVFGCPRLNRIPFSPSPEHMIKGVISSH